MIINVSGYGCTGASAYVDYLKDCEGLQYYNNSMEFQIIQQPDGIQDLYRFLYESGRVHNSIGLVRFSNNIGNIRDNRLNRATAGQLVSLSKKFIDSLSGLKWEGSSTYDPIDLQKFIEKENGRFFRYFFILLNKCFRKKFEIKRNKLFCYLDENEFLEVTQKYLDSILLCSGFDLNKPILLEQAFDCNCPTKGMSFFREDCYCIVVDRDPRDVFLLSNVVFPQLNAFMPHDGNVNAFIKYYRSLHRDKMNTKNVKYLNFEDLVYKYHNTTKQINDWLGLRQSENERHFRPEYSINNTQLFKKFSNYKKEIDAISVELQDLLYDFDADDIQIDFHRVETQPFEHQEDV